MQGPQLQGLSHVRFLNRCLGDSLAGKFTKVPLSVGGFSVFVFIIFCCLNIGTFFCNSVILAFKLITKKPFVEREEVRGHLRGYSGNLFNGNMQGNVRKLDDL